VLADDESGADDIISESAVATVRADALKEVVMALDSKITVQQQAVHVAHANAIRADAARMRAEAAQLQQPIDALLLQLRELAGVDYAPKRVDMPLAMSGQVGGVPTLIQRTLARPDAMLAQATHFDDAANAIERGQPVATSIIDGARLAVIPNYLADRPKD